MRYCGLRHHRIGWRLRLELLQSNMCYRGTLYFHFLLFPVRSDYIFTRYSGQGIRGSVTEFPLGI